MVHSKGVLYQSFEGDLTSQQHYGMAVDTEHPSRGQDMNVVVQSILQ